MKRIVAMIVFLMLTTSLMAQVIYTAQDSIVFEEYLKVMKPKKDLPLQELIVETALYFRGTPYVASTLEYTPEQLVVNLSELDCTTFVESTIALARTVKDKNPSFQKFCGNLQQLRYREASIEDYSSRLHYTSDWIYTNEQRGIVKDISKEAGGVDLPVNLFIMSTNAEKYKQLKGNPELTDKIKEQEHIINGRPHYYIPKASLYKVSKYVRSGDMVCFATTIKGLDVSHVGFAYWKDGKLTFIHASSSAKKVIVNPEPMQSYIDGVNHNRGVLFVRVIE